MTATDMPPLHRHQLAWLSPQGWRELLGRPWATEDLACLQHWADHGWPLVVTMQSCAQRQPADPVALGLPAPPGWPRRRLSLRVTPAQILWFDECPTLDQALRQLPRRARPPLRALHGALSAHGLRARVYGSLGWQQLTGQPYLRPGSDVDLWLAVDDAAHADIAAGLLQACPSRLRLDGELHFPNGDAVAWREWAAWRAGQCRGILVKRLHGAHLAHAVPGQMTGPEPWPQAA